MTDLNELEEATTSNNSDVSQISDLDLSSQVWGNISEDNAKYMQTKGLKSVDALAESYRNLEKLSTSKITIPQSEDKEGWNKLYTKLGRPEKADGYDIEVAEELKSDVQELLFKNGLSSSQAKDLISSYNKLMEDQKTKADALIEEQSKKDLEALKSEWGIDADKNLELAGRGAKALANKWNLSEDDLNNIELSIGTRKFTNLIRDIGEVLSEDGLPVSSNVAKQEALGSVEYFEQIMKGI